eukprot:9483835-Pyramimonas_sp.AAC.1
MPSAYQRAMCQPRLARRRQAPALGDSRRGLPAGEPLAGVRHAMGRGCSCASLGGGFLAPRRRLDPRGESS